MIFRNRIDAGRQLAQRLQHFADRNDVIVLALPRGGVPIGYEVPHALNAPLDVFLVRKVGVPGHAEYAMGAIASGGVRVLNDEAMRMLGISNETFEAVVADEEVELKRRETLYRDGRPAPDVQNKTVILVDDGLATGSSMKAAVHALRRLGPAYIVVAVPVGAADTCAALANEADEAICAREPDPFYGVGLWYQDFTPTSDEEVKELLARAERDLHLQDSVTLESSNQ